MANEQRFVNPMNSEDYEEDLYGNTKFWKQVFAFRLTPDALVHYVITTYVL